jgi:hypothetical protein
MEVSSETDECEESDGSATDEFECPTPLLKETPAVQQGIICRMDDRDMKRYGLVIYL